jgi:hypothetical protein
MSDKGIRCTRCGVWWSSSFLDDLPPDGKCPDKTWWNNRRSPVFIPDYDPKKDYGPCNGQLVWVK